MLGPENENLVIWYSAEPGQRQSWIVRGDVSHRDLRANMQFIAFDDSNDNSIGFEWILMELMSGVPVYRWWRTMSLEQKTVLMKRVAELQVQLFRNGVSGSPFREIGTLDLENGQGSLEAPVTVAPGKLILPEFFVGNCLKYDVPRGPFRNSHDWLSSEIRLMILEQTAVLETTEDKDDREDAEGILGAASRLLSLLPKVFSEHHEDEVATALYHDDLSGNNILVNEQGEITAIVDWECVPAMPIWLTTRMPRFLVGVPREDEPNRDTYSDETPEECAASRANGEPDELDNEGKNVLYWIYLMDYETTKLRKVYEARLRELWPDWPLEGSQMKVDFCDAVLHCGWGIVKSVERWLDSLERGDGMTLADCWSVPII